MRTILFFCLFISVRLPAQFIVAGQHSASDYFHSYNPDTIYSGQTYSHFPIDINNDNVPDINMYVYPYGGGLGEQSWGCSITTLNNNKIAVASYDSCYNDTGGFVFPFPFVQTINGNDTINAALHWDTLAYLHYHLHRPFGPPHTNCANYIDSGYIAFQLIDSNGIQYGWLKVSSIQIYTTFNIAINSFACNSLNAGIINIENSRIDIYPNPADQYIYFDTKFKSFTAIRLFNIYGQLICRNFSNASLSQMDISSFSNGIYFLELETSLGIQMTKLIIRH